METYKGLGDKREDKLARKTGVDVIAEGIDVLQKPSASKRESGNISYHP